MDLATLGDSSVIHDAHIPHGVNHLAASSVLAEMDNRRSHDHSGIIANH